MSAGFLLLECCNVEMLEGCIVEIMNNKYRMMNAEVKLQHSISVILNSGVGAFLSSTALYNPIK